MLGERLEQRAPTIAVWCENGLGFAQVALEGYGGAVVERMGQGGWGVNPVETVRLQREGGEKWGACC
jgi:hypothetical protein